MGLLIVGHILADFYFQTKRIAEKKKNSFWWMLFHGVSYTMVCYVAILLVTNSWNAGLLSAAGLGVLHIIIDEIKVKRDSKSCKHECASFLIDQAIHIVLIGLGCYIFEIPLGVEEYHIFRFYENVALAEVLAIIAAVLICWRPAAIFVALVFKDIPVTIENADNDEECEKDPKSSKKKKDKRKEEQEEIEVAKIGSWIGILEREIILLLGLLGQYGAIGFVLTAKSLARYKQLEKKAFAEKYLVGTLLSCLIAFICVAMCKMFI